MIPLPIDESMHERDARLELVARAESQAHELGRPSPPRRARRALGAALVAAGSRLLQAPGASSASSSASGR